MCFFACVSFWSWIPNDSVFLHLDHGKPTLNLLPMTPAVSGTHDSRQHVFHDVLPNLECGTDFFHRPSQEYHLLWSPGFAWRTGATATMAWHKPQESPSLVKPSEDRFVCCHSWALCFPPLKDMGASHVLQVIIDPMVATLNTSHIAMFLSLQSRLPGWWLRQLRMVYTSHS